MKSKLILLLFAVLVAACGTNETQQDGSASEGAGDKGNLTNIETVIEDYLSLKDALVNSDTAAAAANAAKLESSLKSARFNSNVINAAVAIAGSGIDGQRKAFKQISDTLIHKLTSDNQENELYIQFCPMAFNNEGAAWISKSEEILNPYFGDQMLRCGTVKGKL